ncbi:hypothetical protein IT399_03550 [Candidatus Nomurabacteria bacterium]|nr:hypothetical protein [Candidatus Nomurabacteria bacterium]
MKKFLPYILILVVMFGLFGMAGKVSAESPDDRGDCTITDRTIPKRSPVVTERKNIKRSECTALSSPPTVTVEFKLVTPATEVLGTCTTNGKITQDTKTRCEAGGGTWRLNAADTPDPTTNPPEQKSDFEKMLGKTGCDSLLSFDMGACVLKFLYYGIQMPVAGILWIAAKFFDYLIFFTLSTTLFKQPFVGGAWGVVRDLSNIFFILILLFVAFETILGLAHDAQKTITKVIVVAMLINFSMFFTGVVIDTSNVLALVFYNKVDIKYKDKDGNIKDRPDTPVGNAKDISGSMAEKFNLTNLVTGDMFKQARDTVNKVPGSGQTIGSEGVPTSLMITIVLIAIVIMAVAAYAFIVAGLSFLGRMIELFVLIIFSPFAFMSSTVPKLAGTEYLGWEPWSKRLITVSFMAPIFMFFLYFIFLLMNGPLLEQAKNVSGDSFISMILGMILPTLFIVSLLLKATEFAKKGSGKFGEMTMTGAKLLGGLALGAATGGTAMLAAGTIGRSALKTAGNEELKSLASGTVDSKTQKHFAEKYNITDISKIKEHEEFKKKQADAQKTLARANKWANKSFDIRDTGIGKFAASKTGMNFEKGLGFVGADVKSLHGGWKEREKNKTEKRAKEEEEKVKSYEMSESFAAKQNARAEQYEKDKKEAKERAETPTKTWENGLADELVKAKEDAEKRGVTLNEEVIKQTYIRKNGEKPESAWDEKNFKEAYEKGDRETLKRNFGVEKDEKFIGGEVEKVDLKAVNADRRAAYANSLQSGYEKEEAKKAVHAFYDEFKKGMKGMVATPGGLATTATITAATGGLGIPLAVVGGGFIHALKTTLEAHGDNAKVVSAIRKGKSQKDKAFDELKKFIKEEDEKNGKESKKEIPKAENHPSPTKTEDHNKNEPHPTPHNTHP